MLVQPSTEVNTMTTFLKTFTAALMAGAMMIGPMTAQASSPNLTCQDVLADGGAAQMIAHWIVQQERGNPHALTLKWSELQLSQVIQGTCEKLPPDTLAVTIYADMIAAQDYENRSPQDQNKTENEWYLDLPAAERFGNWTIQARRDASHVGLVYSMHHGNTKYQIECQPGHYWIALLTQYANSEAIRPGIPI